MSRIIFVCLLIGFSLTCNIVVNNKPLIDSQPVLLQTTTNGQKYVIGDASHAQGDYLYVANLKGTPREMGKALGQLFGSDIKQNIDNFYTYYLAQMNAIIQKKKIPQLLKKLADKGGRTLLDKILDLNIRITKKYTNKRYYDQIKGIAEGSKGKVSFKQIARLNLFPELIKAACTVAGVWGKASANGHTLHMRALDWDSSNPISKHPILIVYHPSDPKLQVHGNFAWGGFIGSMTGISQKISLGQKVWLPKPKTSGQNVKMTRYGNPWTYVFRDLLYEATDIKSAIAMLTKTHRTCAIHIGLASVVDRSFRMFEYSQDILNNYDDKNYTNYGPNHPKTQGIAYFDKHVQPSSDSCVGQILTNSEYYGKWDAQSFFRVIGLSHQTGDTQLAVFDLQSKLAYVSYSVNDAKVSIKGYNRSPIKVNLAKFFAPF